MANTLAEAPLYRWVLLSPDGRPAQASNGMEINVDFSIDETPRLPVLFVLASYEPEEVATPRILGWLRRQAIFGTTLGSVDNGSFVLARAGLLNGYRATAHWEMLDQFLEIFPRVDFVQDLFTIDRDRITSAGAASSLDLMLNLIRAQHGQDLAAKTADEFIYARIREPGDLQRLPLRQRLDAHSPKLVKAVETMEAHLSAPLSTAAVAARAGMSVKALEQLFRRWLRTTPGAYYRKLRLERARSLLQQSDLPLLEIAMESGFSSQAYFSTAYKAHFGRPPSAERRQIRPRL